MNDLNFPSSRKIQMTEIERPLRRKKNPVSKFDLVDWFLFTVFIIALLILGLTIEKVIIDPWLSAQGVQAAEMTEADYCTLIKNHGTKVIGASEEEITSHCARWGIEL